MRSYVYKVINIDASMIALRRSLLYVAILLSVCATALAVLFILFELYFRLFISAAVYLIAFFLQFMAGKIRTVYTYSFNDSLLKIEKGNGKSLEIPYEKIDFIKNADNSEFFKKDIINLTFIKNKIIIKSELNENSFSAKQYILQCENDRYIVTLDEYAIAILTEEKDDILL